VVPEPSDLLVDDAAARVMDAFDRYASMLNERNGWPDAVKAGGRVARNIGHDTAFRSARLSLGQMPGTGWQRRVTGKSCDWCLSFARVTFPTAAAASFGHDRCVIGSTSVTSASPRGLVRRWYDGELVVLRTASGNELTVTPNHPILARRGWVPAGLLEYGDDVVSGTGAERAPVVIPHEHDMPATIEQGFRAQLVRGLATVPFAAEDFHGDIGHGDVDVVPADSGLHARGESALFKEAQQALLSLRLGSSFRRPRLCRRHQAILSGGYATDRLVRRSGLSRTLVGGHPVGATLPGIRHASWLDSSLQQLTTDSIAGDPVGLAELELALAGQVPLDQVGRGLQSAGASRDAAALHLPQEWAGGNAGPAGRLLERLAGQVQLDRVVELRRVSGRCHVYNLSTEDGWYSANGILVHNCDCVVVPVSESAAHNERVIGERNFTPENYSQRQSLQKQVRTAKRRQDEARQAQLSESDPVCLERLSTREQEWETRAEFAQERLQLLTQR